MKYEQFIRRLEAHNEKAEARIKKLKDEIEADQEIPLEWKPGFGEEWYTDELRTRDQKTRSAN